MSVVICTYTDKRWAEFSAGVRAVQSQLQDGDDLVVVVDHAPELLDRVVAELGLTPHPNAGARGLSGGRNTGVAAAQGDVVVFLDDDALPAPGWVEGYRQIFLDPTVVAAGGAVNPAWEGGRAPRWFPEEFGWVVGCDYVGLPESGSEIRNPIGASMAVRRQAVLAVGGFSELVGRVGALPVGAEETDLAIRLRQADPSARILRDTSPEVAHLVPRDRQTTAYFRRRCWHEGRSKAVLSSAVGASDGLSSERTYTTKVLPQGVVRHVASGFRGDPAGFARAGMIPWGLAVTGAGYVSTRVRRVRSVSG